MGGRTLPNGTTTVVVNGQTKIATVFNGILTVDGKSYDLVDGRYRRREPPPPADPPGEWEYWVFSETDDGCAYYPPQPLPAATRSMGTYTYNG